MGLAAAALFRLRPWRLILVKHSVCQLLDFIKLNIYLIDFIGVYSYFRGNICGEIGGLGLPQIVRLTKFVIFLPFSRTFFGMVRFCGVRTHEIFGFYKTNTGRLNKRFQTACAPCVRLRCANRTYALLILESDIWPQGRIGAICLLFEQVSDSSIRPMPCIARQTRAWLAPHTLPSGGGFLGCV